MARALTVGSLVLLVIGSGCGVRVDVAREAHMLLETDRVWAQAAAFGDNAGGILAYWSDDARVAMAGQPILGGKAAIRQMVGTSLAVPGFHIAWTPDTAVVSGSGDLGYTVGTNALTVPESTGRVTTYSGRYLTVWRRDADGRWRCVVDYSNPGPPATPTTPS